jgi:hypothetical protein
MNRRVVLGTLFAAVLGLVGWAGLNTRAEDKPAADKDHAHGHFDQCARACADCMRECESCAHHCAHMVAEGKKAHLVTLGTCTDCGDICGVAAKIASRRGPMAVPMCEGCARACDACGTACEKFPDDDHMKRCAKSCRDCAKACREMVKHTGHEPKGEKK